MSAYLPQHRLLGPTPKPFEFIVMPHKWRDHASELRSHRLAHPRIDLGIDPGKLANGVAFEKPRGSARIEDKIKRAVVKAIERQKTQKAFFKS